jgi:pilus assembly protein CpaF
MVNGWDKIFIEQEGHLITWNKTFTSSGKLEDVIQQIVARCNRVINTLHPIVDARLENGARVNAVIPPVSVDGPILTIRQFPKEAITMKTLLEKQSITKQVLSFLLPLVKARYTILIGGGTGAGKTTFLNALSAYIPKDERIITIEDNAELQIQGIPNLVRLECRMANIEDSQEITTADLLKTALRMRPDRIIVGEVRSEASELLQAVNVGSEGSLSTIHANSCADMVSRLETLVLVHLNMPITAIRRQIVSGFDLFIHLGRLRDKSRKVLEISELDGLKNGEVQLNPIFCYEEEQGLVFKNHLKHTEKLERAGISYETLLCETIL